MLSHIAATAKGSIIIAAAVYAFSLLLRPQDAEWVKRTALKVFLGLYLIGMLAPNPWVLFASIMLIIPLLAKNKSDAVSIYVITTCAAPVLYSKVVAGGIFLFPVTKFLFASFGLLIGYMVTRTSQPRLRGHFDLPIIIMFILEVSQIWDPYPGLFLRQAVTLPFTLLLPFYLTSRSLNTPEDVRRLMLSFATAGFVLAIVATAESRMHWLLYKQIESHLGISSPTNPYQQLRGGALRAPASFMESTSLGNFLAAAGVVILALRASFPSKAKFYVAFAVIAIGLIAPNSRGAFFGIAVGVLALDFYRRRWAALSAKLGTLCALYLAALIASPFSTRVAEMIGKGESSQGSTQYRVLLLHRGLAEIQKHPFLGTTMKRALDDLSDITQGQHIVDLVNAYVSYGLTLGYPGMIGLATVFVSLCIAMLKARRRLSANQMLLNSAGFVFSVSAFMIGVAAFTGFGGEAGAYYYQICAIGSSLWALRRVAASAEQGASQIVAAGDPHDIRAMILADRERARARNVALSSAPSG